MPTPQDASAPARHTEEVQHGARIKVIGVGGAGNNAIDWMIASGMEGVEFIALNTDVQALQSSRAETRLQIGSRLTNGLGAGSDPDIGRLAAIDDSGKILDALDGADMVFVTAGLGGGTGTGAAPVIAALASQMGALTVAIVTRPFGFEGKRRMAIADWGIHHLLDYVDTLIVIPNEKLLAVAKDAPFFESFRIADDFLRQAVQGISDIITTPGVINRDFADVKTTMAGMGYAVMGTASRSGPARAVDAVMGAMASPLLEGGAIDGARGILINITGSSSLRLSEVNAASSVIQSVAHEDANIIFGAVLDERLGDEVKATVIATGFRSDGRDRSERRAWMLREPGADLKAEPPTFPAQTVEAQPDPEGEARVGSATADPVAAEPVATQLLADEPVTEDQAQVDLAAESQEAFLHDDWEPELSVEQQAFAPSEEHNWEHDPHSGFRHRQQLEHSYEAVALLPEPDAEAAARTHETNEDLAAPEPTTLAIVSREETSATRSSGLDQIHDGDLDSIEDIERLLERILGSQTVALESTPLPSDPVTQPPISHSRQAAMAAYAAVSVPEVAVEPSRGQAPLGFAEILEARRRFVESIDSPEPEFAEPSPSIADGMRTIDDLYEERRDEKVQASRIDGENTRDVEIADRDETRATPIADSNSLSPESPDTRSPKVEEGSSDRTETSLSRPAQREKRDLAHAAVSEELPRPLPDFNRRLHRESKPEGTWELPANSSEPEIHIPSFAAGPEAERYTDQFDELDIPAFLRRGRG
jgi:cell division protein FtsZ